MLEVHLPVKNARNRAELNIFLQEYICWRVSKLPTGASSNALYPNQVESGAPHMPGNGTWFSAQN